MVFRRARFPAIVLPSGMAFRAAPAAVLRGPLTAAAAVHDVSEMPGIPAGSLPAFWTQMQLAVSARSLEHVHADLVNAASLRG